jgi:hypothetical protein
MHISPVSNPTLINATINSLRHLESDNLQSIHMKYDLIKDAEIKDTKISVKTEEGMKERFDRYQELKNTNIPMFDSSMMSPEEILVKLEKILYN